jgi:fructose-1,6-bisphosphatase I
MIRATLRTPSASFTDAPPNLNICIFVKCSTREADGLTSFSLICKGKTDFGSLTMPYSGLITLEQFIVDQQSLYKDAGGSLSKIFRSLELAAKMVNRDVRKAGLVDILGNQGSTNVQGEEQKKLDVIANDIFLQTLSRSGEVSIIISEENDEAYFVPGCENEKYVVAIDPLDGSSNIDVNASIGTIFSIYRRPNAQKDPTVEDCLQKGKHQVAAGYFIYGSSTMLVYTTGVGVNGFTLDDNIQEFCLSHPNIEIPEDGKIYSVNEGNTDSFPEAYQRYLAYCKEKDKASNRPYSARYIGSLIADFHRNLLKGGVFLYPPTQSAPNGKLRLMYECNPMSFLVEQAGGSAHSGSERILQVAPTELHQRVPVIMGSKNMVDKVLEFIAETSLQNA